MAGVVGSGPGFLPRLGKLPTGPLARKRPFAIPGRVSTARFFVVEKQAHRIRFDPPGISVCLGEEVDFIYRNCDFIMQWCNDIFENLADTAVSQAQNEFHTVIWQQLYVQLEVKKTGYQILFDLSSGDDAAQSDAAILEAAAKPSSSISALGSHKHCRINTATFNYQTLELRCEPTEGGGRHLRYFDYNSSGKQYQNKRGRGGRRGKQRGRGNGPRADAEPATEQ